MGDSRDSREWKIWKAALWNALFLVSLFTSLYLLGWVSGVPPEVRQVPYSELEQALAAGRVGSVVISDRDVVARLKAPDAKGARSLSRELVVYLGDTRSRPSCLLSLFSLSP